MNNIVRLTKGLKAKKRSQDLQKFGSSHGLEYYTSEQERQVSFTEDGVECMTAFIAGLLTDSETEVHGNGLIKDGEPGETVEDRSCEQVKEDSTSPATAAKSIIAITDEEDGYTVEWSTGEFQYIAAETLRSGEFDRLLQTSDYLQMLNDSDVEGKSFCEQGKGDVTAKSIIAITDEDDGYTVEWSTGELQYISAETLLSGEFDRLLMPSLYLLKDSEPAAESSKVDERCVSLCEQQTGDGAALAPEAKRLLTESNTDVFKTTKDALVEEEKGEGAEVTVAKPYTCASSEVLTVKPYTSASSDELMVNCCKSVADQAIPTSQVSDARHYTCHSINELNLNYAKSVDYLAENTHRVTIVKQCTSAIIDELIVNCTKSSSVLEPTHAIPEAKALYTGGFHALEKQHDRLVRKLNRAINEAEKPYRGGFLFQENEQKHVFTSGAIILIAEWANDIISSSALTTSQFTIVKQYTCVSNDKPIVNYAKSVTIVKPDACASSDHLMVNCCKSVAYLAEDTAATTYTFESSNELNHCGGKSVPVLELGHAISEAKVLYTGAFHAQQENHEHGFTPLVESQIRDYVSKIISSSITKLRSFPAAAQQQRKHQQLELVQAKLQQRKNPQLQLLQAKLQAKQQLLTAEMAEIEVNRKQLQAAIAAHDAKQSTKSAADDYGSLDLKLQADGHVKTESLLSGHLLSEMCDVSSYGVVLNKTDRLPIVKPSKASRPKRLKKWVLQTLLRRKPGDRPGAEPILTAVRPLLQ